MINEVNVKGLSSRLVILGRASRADAATFACKVKNKFGASSKITRIVVKVRI